MSAAAATAVRYGTNTRFRRSTEQRIVQRVSSVDLNAVEKRRVRTCSDETKGVPESDDVKRRVYLTRSA